MIKIEKQALDLMIKDAEDTFPNECCGFFYGIENEEGTRLISIAQIVENSKEGDQRRRFEISPFAYMKAENYALENNLTLLGVYHSHPQHPAIASEHDLAKAMPYFSYVILSVMDAKTVDIKSWRLLDSGEKFIEETVSIDKEDLILQNN